jgi:hypothetical protein
MVTRELATPDEEERYLDHQAALALEGREYAPGAALALAVAAYNAALAKVGLGLKYSAGIAHEKLVSPSTVRHAIEARLRKVGREAKMPDDVRRARTAKLHLFALSRKVVQRRCDEADARDAGKSTC